MTIFEEIKEGDHIVIDKGGGGYMRVEQSLFLIAQVTKVTATQLAAGSLRFSRRDGYEISGREIRNKAKIATAYGSDYSRRRLMTPEEAEAKNKEIKRELDHKALAYRIRDIKFIELPYETLLKLAEVLGMEDKL